MAQTMRGLNLFIANIRAARVGEAERLAINKEMANIRTKFASPNLSAYDRKKYVAKIAFCFIMGYKQDLGHMEAIQLLTAQKYSEKQIGYLAVTLMLTENSDLLRLVVNSIKKDLDDRWDVVNCLALQTIANIGGDEMAEALAPDVHKLMISPTSNNFVKKKAALALLRMYRKYPQVIPAQEWALRIISLMDDSDLGVVVAVTSLVLALAQDFPEAYETSYQKAVDRLYKLVVGHQYDSRLYDYYKIPSPWLQVKLLKLLQYYPPPEDAALRRMMEQVLATLLEMQEIPRSVQHNNALHAVLFEAINTIIHIDARSSLATQSAQLLGRFLSSKETNVRYLALNTMAHLAALAETLDPIKKHQTTIIMSLRDKDISVRRRALDLLYSMCDVDNAEIIVGELLNYLKIADYGLREEMVLKIAICCEKFATEYKWYVDTILELISAAGDYVGDEVWYRVIQIVTNTEDLQAYAAHTCFNYLKSPTCHESLVKIAGYILGEYGHLIANEAGCSPYEQFQTLHAKSNFCNANTRALILTTYIKWVNVFPEIKPQLMTVFDRYRHVLDSELQQRACEYLALAERPEDDELLQTVWDEMPPFPERESALLNRLARKHGDTGDKRTWVVGGKEGMKDAQMMRMKSLKRVTTSSTTTASPSRNRPHGAATSVPNGATDIMAALAELDMSGGPSANGEEAILRSPDLDARYQKLLFSDSGLLYDDVQMGISLKSDYRMSHGRMRIFFHNKLPTALDSLTAIIKSPQHDHLTFDIRQFPVTTVQSNEHTMLEVEFECKELFTQPPTLHVSFLTGSLTSLVLRLPVVIHKFFEPIQLEPQDFYMRWQKIGGPPREAQVFFPIALKRGDVDTLGQQATITGARIRCLEGVDPNLVNMVGAAVVYTSATGKAGFLIRVEPSREEKKCRLTVRCTSDNFALALTDYIRDLLAAK
ncbi:AP-2 adaptor complex subunit alpha [Dacryopinax primogenitus]|uniref:AP-2 complex subunit alpha n=1 Tax=Dacryopinax primogenitus (strain DJM 731) TaxID=1858805 RepID=M5G1D4_DACPD|nr:AP-2 adaptor complex subunit alpha [Dacryopinax primogenitus]EJU02005.1 AP-2 adaptor complex subunit alpha [Dacryopinax primogenitus]